MSVTLKLEWRVTTIGVGYNRAKIVVSNTYNNVYTIFLRYVSGPTDYIRYGYAGSTITIYKGSYKSIGDVLPNSTVVWDPVFLEFPEEGTYVIEFLAGAKGTAYRTKLQAYTVVVGEAPPTVPLYIEDVSIPWYRPTDGAVDMVVKVSFSTIAPANTTIYTKYFVDSEEVGEEEYTLEKPAYVLSIPRTEPKRQGDAYFMACASLDKDLPVDKWVCSNKIYIGTGTPPQPPTPPAPRIPWQLLALLGIGMAFIGMATAEKK